MIYLHVTHNKHLEQDFDNLLMDADIFSFGFVGDKTTIYKFPLINVLASGYHVLTMVVKAVDYTDQLF